MLTVARALNCPLHISHLKAMGMRNWNRSIPRALEIMDKARQEGMKLTCDVYLYEAGSTQLLHLLPPDFLEGGVDAICARLRQKEQREVLKERIQNGRDYDNIAQMIGWDNIILSTMQKEEFLPLIGKTVTEVAEILKLPEAIVYCIDCKHRPSIHPGYEECYDGFGIEFPDNVCPCQCEDGWYNWMPKDNWFCAKGEKKWMT